MRKEGFRCDFCLVCTHPTNGMTMDPFLYVYAVGGIVFGIGLFYGFRQGYLGFSGAALRNLLILLGGLAFFMGS